MTGRSWKVGWRSVAGTLGWAALGACQQERNFAPPTHSMHEATTVSAAKADDLEEVIRAVRRLTQPYENLSVAMAAGYNAQLTGCMENPPAGGMGFHYGAPALIDGRVEPLKPEILLYEPQANGKLRFVGVEYVVPYTAWTNPNPPALVGVPFHRNDAFGLWVIHVWVAKKNPAGILSDWNPTVSCRYATSTQ